MSIQVKQLRKVFGSQEAVKEVSFSIEKGEIVGFLGPNGAGKSTTMKIATGYLPPTEGTVEVAGFDVVSQSKEVRKRIGYLPEHNPLYLDMYVKEYLGFIASLHGIKGKRKKSRVSEMVALCGLTDEQNKPISALSKGYRQRVGLAQALIHDPEVLILDEPTTGLDPNQLTEIRKLIQEVSQDKTVILSTHIMQEVKAICNRAIIINKGQIVADDSVENLAAGKKGQRLKVEFQSNVPVGELKELKGIEILNNQGNHFEIATQESGDLRERLFKYAAEKGWVILSMQLQEEELEDVFFNLTKGSEDGSDLS